MPSVEFDSALQLDPLLNAAPWIGYLQARSMAWQRPLNESAE
jgi:hypothetical protein